ncbi:MAG: methenyltetrahydromethanopterin cyclohydrolase [Acidiferrobacterales bacterium]|nr:methenyltetrahydromethanopterin cyclohydrolase [Acidiferrobacterales bacterium]
MTGSRKDWPSVNELAAPLVQALVQDARSLGLAVDKRSDGATVVDAGINSPGSFEAGRRIAEVSMAGLGDVSFSLPRTVLNDCPDIRVQTDSPVLACLGSQYAGWSLEYPDPEFRALGSGPARALAAVESLYEHIGYRDQFDQACIVIETSDFPPDGMIEQIANECSIRPENLTLILTPTGSRAGVTQIAARVVEVAMHKAHEIQFDINSIVRGEGTAIVAPPCADFLSAMGRTNDSILYGGEVTLQVSCDSASAELLARNLPSCNSSDYGIPFSETFRNCNYDFYQIDPMLFSPAQVSIHNIATDEWFYSGRINRDLLEQSFRSGE